MNIRVLSISVLLQLKVHVIGSIHIPDRQILLSHMYQLFLCPSAQPRNKSCESGCTFYLSIQCPVYRLYPTNVIRKKKPTFDDLLSDAMNVKLYPPPPPSPFSSGLEHEWHISRTLIDTFNRLSHWNQVYIIK